MLNVGQTDITPWLIGIVVVVFLVAIIVGFIWYSRRQKGESAQADAQAAKEVREAATKARDAAAEAEKAAQES